MASGLRMWAGLSEGFVGTEDIEDRLVVGSPGSSLVLLCRFGMAPPYFWG